MQDDTIDYEAIAAEAVDILLKIGCFGLHSSNQRELWQMGLDLSHRLHPDRNRSIVWTKDKGDVRPAKSES